MRRRFVSVVLLANALAGGLVLPLLLIRLTNEPAC